MTSKVPILIPRGPSLDLAIRYLRNNSYEESRYSNFGPLVRKLEARVAARYRVNPAQVVTASNATTGLTLALMSSNKTLAQLPDFSFVATLSAARAAGKTTEFRDVRASSWLIEMNLPGRSGDILVPVMPFGAWNQELLDNRQKSMVIDAAASFGLERDLSALDGNKSIVFSLHATKILGSGEGGVCIFGSEDWATEARSMSNFGMDQHRSIKNVGINGKMSEFQAAFCLAAMDESELEMSDWHDAMDLARDASRGLGLELSPQAFDVPAPYWIAKINQGASSLRQLTDFFSSRGVEVRSWWPHSLAELSGVSSLPVSSLLRREFVGLPLFRGITREQIDSVTRAVEEWQLVPSDQ